jgi:dihydroorotase-like cyclic amidohydrolase
MITLSRLVELTSKNIAASLSKKAGVIEVGADADLILFDINKEYTVQNPQSLYHGELLNGEVMKIFK